MNRNQFGEPAFGEKLAPILKDIETAIWEHNANFEGERPLYPDEAMRSAACIFIDVLIDRMFAKQEKDGKPLKAREQEVTSVGRMLYDTEGIAELVKNKAIKYNPRWKDSGTV